jgi:hypothetical protein
MPSMGKSPGIAHRATVVHAAAVALSLVCAGGGLVSTAQAAAPREAAGGIAVPPVVATCPGPKASLPTCPAPADGQCADARWYSDPANAACVANWSDHCACVNQNQLSTAETSSGGELDRRPIHGSQLLPGSASPNVTHVPRYGIDPGLLTTQSPIPVKGSPLSTSINGTVPARTLGPMVGLPKRSGPRSRLAATSGAPKPTVAVPASKQNTWAAHETLWRAQAVNACAKLAGAALVRCAKDFARSGISSGTQIKSPEDFVFKRFYDLEHWLDQVNACGADVHCQADVSLDPSSGIVGHLISGNDISAATRQKIQSGLDPQNPIVCGNPSLSAAAIEACNLAKSTAPVGLVTPPLLGSVAGGGAPGPFMTANGVQNIASANASAGLFAQSTGYWMNKNPFYDAAPLFTPLLASVFAGDPGKAQSIQRLIAELKRGTGYYYVGQPHGGSQKKSFPDEWSYERALNTETHAEKPGVFADYAKRKAFLKHRVDVFGLLLADAKSATLQSNRVSNGAQIRHKNTDNTLVQGPTLQGSLPNPAYSQSAGEWSLVPIIPTDMDAAAWAGTVPPLDPAYSYPRLLCPAVDRLRAGYSPRVGQPIDFTRNGVQAYGQAEIRAAACNYVNAVFDEWARKDSVPALARKDTTVGPSGCFADDAACDWNPGEFMIGLEDLVNNQIANVESAQREADYKTGRVWWPSIAKPDPQNLSIVQNAMTSETSYLAAVRSVMEIAFKHIKDVPIRDQGPGATGANAPAWASSSAVSAARRQVDHFATFGEDRHNAELWGNDTFGVGYDYDLGWELPMEWQKDQSGNQWEICDFGAGAHAKLEAYAYAFGSDKFDIIDADFVAGAHDGAGTDTLVPDSAKLGADLTIAGDSLFSFNPTPLPLNTPKSFPLAQGSNSWTLFEVPFQISFLTLTVKVGVGYSYDVNATVTPQHNNACTGKHPARPSLGVTSTVAPDADLNGIVDADVGIGPPGLADVGMEVNLTLLGIGLPANAGLNLVGQGYQFDLQVNEGLNMDFHTLDGSLSVFADLLFFRLFDITLVSWKGIHHTIPLFNTTQTLHLADLNVVGGTGLQNPAGSLADL